MSMPPVDLRFTAVPPALPVLPDPDDMPDAPPAVRDIPTRFKRVRQDYDAARAATEAAHRSVETADRLDIQEATDAYLAGKGDGSVDRKNKAKAQADFDRAKDRQKALEDAVKQTAAEYKPALSEHGGAWMRTGEKNRATRVASLNRHLDQVIDDLIEIMRWDLTRDHIRAGGYGPIAVRDTAHRQALEVIRASVQRETD